MTEYLVFCAEPGSRDPSVVVRCGTNFNADVFFLKKWSHQGENLLKKWSAQGERAPQFSPCANFFAEQQMEAEVH